VKKKKKLECFEVDSFFKKIKIKERNGITNTPYQDNLNKQYTKLLHDQPKCIDTDNNCNF